MKINSFYYLITIVTLITASCTHNNKAVVSGVEISFPGNNILSAIVEAHTNTVQKSFIKYWIVGQKEKSVVSQGSDGNTAHRFLLANLKPASKYVFNIFTSGKIFDERSQDYFFNTIDYSNGIQDTLSVVCKDTSLLPQIFKEGSILIHRREVPGIVLLLNANGNIIWFHQAKDAGFKVVNFTGNHTLLCLMGTQEYETSYGSAILELSLNGDTILYLKKGQNDFKQTIHHEIILNPKNQLVTLCVEDTIMDLRSRGGLIKDTVRGDGILVMDREGHKIWKWTVFDELDPLLDEKIVETKKDWMHANSISFDKDGNYLISFYNNGQIWKLDAITGRVIWKLGRKGDFKIPPEALFDQAHAVYINEKGWLQLFDNGTKNRLSRSLAY
ncbi:MAG: aryl-sulfate sulfotransferase, partial [Ginsengibacter sp.]